MAKKTFWKRYKSYIIGLAIVVLIASIFIPAKIEIPGRTLDDYDELKGQIANITLVEKLDYDTVIYEVQASPKNFFIKVHMPEGIGAEVGARGCIIDSSELIFDGSHEHPYGFLFPRNGSLFQKALTFLGIYNFNPSIEGHIENRLGASVDSEVTVGDHLYLGKAKFHPRFGDAFSKGIEWRVLAIEDDRALLIANDIIELRGYHNTDADVTWETCDVRSWLNGEFYNGLPNSVKSVAIPVQVTNGDNPVYDTDGGNDTEDTVFLLSLDEANAYFSSDDDRRAQILVEGETRSYIRKAYGVDPVTDAEEHGGYTWWLRTPGDLFKATFVGANGSLGTGEGIFDDGITGTSVSMDGNSIGGVRPALWVQVESEQGDSSANAPIESDQPQVPAGVVDGMETGRDVDKAEEEYNIREYGLKPKEQTIDWSDARNYIGQTVTVEGTVVEVARYQFNGGIDNGGSEIFYLNLGNAFPDINRFTAIIWYEDILTGSVYEELTYSSAVVGYTIQITGTVIDYEGVPEIEIRSNSQVKVTSAALGDWLSEM
ncbi:DUF6273 domain-containing protein [Arabiibacter massiliensis]|uniref:DUF6273 domain-containing protein n=1 Tax=Arabiibacter massiliensis TaxID=1870985 RepID=UPI00117AF741|nr:DUF6273 domain-containing protein [Arabiibacter massiliensis]